MADEKDEAPPSLPYDLTNPNIATVYANRALAIIGDTDISLYFGTELHGMGSIGMDREETRMSTRLVLNHAQFMRIMEYLSPRYDVLNTMYRGLPLSLDQISFLDPQRAREAWQKLVPQPRSEKESEEHDSSQAEDKGSEEI